MFSTPYMSLIFIPQSIFKNVKQRLVLSVNVLDTLNVINIHFPINIHDQKSREAAACAEHKRS